MRVILEHRREKLKNGRWAAGFSLEFFDGTSLISRQCFDPEIELTFESEEQARGRNRELALNWKQAAGPEIELCERAA
ncbi:MAG TPA: hypothetical protein VN742_10010 [Candidatus Binataceae bacterium]|jgi:hypothetical protein|nr:hypothetical protein [Candidatus Binataceae bacterium]